MEKSRIEQLTKLVEQQLEEIQSLKSQVAELQEKLATSSVNSSLPPSKDRTNFSRPAKVKSSKQRGAQAGHKGHRRELWSEEKVNHVVTCPPPEQCLCGGAVIADQGPYYRHQVFDIPPPQISVTEYQWTGGYCDRCHKRHKAATPDSMPSTQMGAGLLSLIALLSGSYHQSVSQIQDQLKDVYGLPFSRGAISEAMGKINPMLTRSCQNIHEQIKAEPIIHADETRHPREGELRWFWLASTNLLTYCKVFFSRGSTSAKALLGEETKAIVITDQYSGYYWLGQDQHQLCWAHLLRNFEKIANREGVSKTVGEKLRQMVRCLFHLHHRFLDGKIPIERYHMRLNKIRTLCHHWLMLGTQCDHEKTKNSCALWLKQEAMFWTFAQDPQNIDLTNNQAERDIRPYVCWRKNSYGTQSHRGDQYRARMITIVETLKKQERSAYTFFNELIDATLNRTPDLLPEI
jgi:hypothetical protein